MSENKGRKFGKMGKQKQGIDGVVTLLATGCQKGVKRGKEGRQGGTDWISHRGQIQLVPSLCYQTRNHQKYAHDLTSMILGHSLLLLFKLICYMLYVIDTMIPSLRKLKKELNR